jgi:hypothetical protein
MATQASPAKPQVQAAAGLPQKRKRTAAADMAFTLSILDDKGTDNKRMPSKASAIKVSAGDGKFNVIRLADLPADVRAQLEVDALKRKLTSLLKNTKKTNPAEVHTITNSVVKSLKDGSIFAYKDSGGPGRSVDFGFWADVFALAAEIKIKVAKENGIPTDARLMTPKDREELLAKFEAMPKADWEAKKKLWTQNKLYNNAALKVRSQRADAKMAKEALKANDIDFTKF